MFRAMSQQDYFRLFTKGVKFTQADKEILNKCGHNFKVKEEEIKENESKKRKKEDSNDEDSGEESCLESKKIVPKKKQKTKEQLINIHQQEIGRLRKKFRIHVYGSDICPPVETFDQLLKEYNVSKILIDNLWKEKFSLPTAIQMQAWPLMMRRRELLASAETGSGKTAAFLLPILHHLKSHRTHGFRAIILTPIRELSKQIVRECDRLAEGTGLKSSIIRKIQGKYCTGFIKSIDICVTTPNRLIYLMKESTEMNDTLSKVEWLVVDESDRLYETGAKGFRDQLAQIYKACSGPNVVRAMFSATFDVNVEMWCKMNLNDPAVVTVGARNSSCTNVHQELVFCGSENEGKVIALREIFRQGYDPLVLVFVQTKERVRQLYKEFLLDGRRVGCIHSDNTQAQRDSIVQDFRERKIWILFCTDLMARGVDFPGVNMVINYDFPPSIVSYIHRVGRTGRAGYKGAAKTFWTMKDKPLLRSIGEVIKQAGSPVPDFILELKKESKNVRKKFATALPDRGFISQRSKDELLDIKRKRNRRKKLEKKGKNKESEGNEKSEQKTTDGDKKLSNKIEEIKNKKILKKKNKEK